MADSWKIEELLRDLAAGDSPRGFSHVADDYAVAQEDARREEANPLMDLYFGLREQGAKAGQFAGDTMGYAGKPEDYDWRNVPRTGLGELGAMAGAEALDPVNYVAGPMLSKGLQFAGKAAPRVLGKAGEFVEGLLSAGRKPSVGGATETMEILANQAGRTPTIPQVTPAPVVRTSPTLVPWPAKPGQRPPFPRPKPAMGGLDELPGSATSYERSPRSPGRNTPTQTIDPTDVDGLTDVDPTYASKTQNEDILDLLARALKSGGGNY